MSRPIRFTRERVENRAMIQWKWEDLRLGLYLGKGFKGSPVDPSRDHSTPPASLPPFATACPFLLYLHAPAAKSLKTAALILMERKPSFITLTRLGFQRVCIVFHMTRNWKNGLSLKCFNEIELLFQLNLLYTSLYITTYEYIHPFMTYPPPTSNPSIYATSHSSPINLFIY